MHLAALEVVRQEGEEERDDERDPARDRQAAQDEVRRQGDERKREQEEEVDDERRIPGAEAEDPEEEEVQRLPADHRVVVELLVVGRSELGVLEVPGVLEDALDQRQVEGRVAGVGERRSKVRAPELQHEGGPGQGEHHGGAGEERVAPSPHWPIDTSRSLARPSGSSSRARRRWRIARSCLPVASSKRPSSYHDRQLSGWRSTAST